MKIAVLGTGRIGSVLGRKWAAAGYEVIFGSRSPESAEVEGLVETCGSAAEAGTVQEAIHAGEALLFATPSASVADIAAANAGGIERKLLIDATNNFFSGGPISSHAVLTAAAPSARYYRAFNSLGFEIFEDPDFDGVQADMFFCGPDGQDRQFMERLIAAVGVRPIWVGDNDLLHFIDALGAIWVTLVFRRGMPRDAMFKLVQRSVQPANQPTSYPAKLPLWKPSTT